MNDNQIVALFFERDQRAIEETAKKYSSYCYCIAYSILQNREDAEEVVSDTFLGAWTAIPPHKPAQLRTFLGKIARRTALKRWERSRTQKRGGGEVALALEELSDLLPGGSTPERTIEEKELTQILNAFLRKLPQEDRQVFVCRYWYLDSIGDIARRFGFTQSKVKSILYRSRTKLRDILNKEEITV